jgi:hypothetical protein
MLATVELALPSRFQSAYRQEARRFIKECDAELRLRKMTTGEGMSASEIRELVERMHGIVAILQSATTEDRRRV